MFKFNKKFPEWADPTEDLSKLKEYKKTLIADFEKFEVPDQRKVQNLLNRIAQIEDMAEELKEEFG